MVPVDELVDAVVLGVLNDPRNRIAIVDRDRADDEDDMGSLLYRYNALVAKKNGLGALFADGVLDAGQVRAATEELRAQIEAAAGELARARRRSPAADLVLADGALENRWAALPAEVRSQVIDELMTVTILPAGRGRFDPSKVRIEWKSAPV
jgi:hypothetical protein